jgi:hypothetical protein
MTRWQIFDELCGLLRAGLHNAPPRLPDDLPWERLIEASSYHYVTPFLAWSLQNTEGVDPEAGQYLAAVLTLNTQRNQQLVLVIERVAEALNAIGVVPVLFKGAAHLVGALYPEQGLRIVGDIDFLVPGGRAPDIAKALKRAGFEPIKTSVLVKVENPYLPHYQDRITGAVLDIHRHIAPSKWQAVAEPAGFEARCRPATLAGAHARLPGPADLIAHSIVHNQLKDGYYRRNVVQLRQLLDLRFLCDRHENEIDWMELESRFEKTGNASVLSTNFHLLEALLHRNAPAFKCPPRALALESLRAMIENPRYQRQSLLAAWVSQYLAQLRARPLSVLNLLNARTFMPRLRRLDSILREKKW